ncbi:MAG: SpoIIE family protein phosphatase [Planctomycetota bacterium]|nr:SpoIIE family protein phosphatase [Planctomycetota bacterium]
MSIRIKTIIGIVVIQVVALAIVVWANIDLLSKSNAQLFEDQANAVAAMAAQRAWTASKKSPAAFVEEVERIQAADPRLKWIRLIPPGESIPEATRDTLVRTVRIKDSDEDPGGDQVAVAMDRTSMRTTIDNALFRSIGIAVLEIMASIAFSLWLANWLLGRLSTLQAASQSIAEGDFSRRVPIEGSDEISDTAIAFNTMATRLSGLVERVRDETARREVIEGELRVARQIQDSLQPDACPQFAELPRIEVEAVEDPIQEVAGDFYDWFAIGNDRLAIVIADVAGKGVPAGLFAAACLTVVRTLARTGIEPAEVLMRANAQLSERNREQMFVSLSLLYLDAGNGDILAAVAGHPASRILRADGSIERVLGNTGPILGVIPDARWEQVHARLDLEDRLVLTTDGLLEARDGEGNMLEEAGFDALLSAVGDVDAAQTARRLAWAVRTREGDDTHDDLTVVVVRRIEEATNPEAKE